jgi:hypothetical protein
VKEQTRKGWETKRGQSLFDKLLSGEPLTDEDHETASLLKQLDKQAEPEEPKPKPAPTLEEINAIRAMFGMKPIRLYEDPPEEEMPEPTAEEKKRAAKLENLNAFRKWIGKNPII